LWTLWLQQDLDTKAIAILASKFDSPTIHAVWAEVRHTFHFFFIFLDFVSVNLSAALDATRCAKPPASRLGAIGGHASGSEPRGQARWQQLARHAPPPEQQHRRRFYARAADA
jgi:hypothetical protein